MRASASIRRGVESHAYDEKLVGVESELHGEDAVETLQEETRADEEYDRCSDLEPDDDGAEPLAASIHRDSRSRALERFRRRRGRALKSGGDPRYQTRGDRGQYRKKYNATIERYLLEPGNACRSDTNEHFHAEPSERYSENSAECRKDESFEEELSNQAHP